MERQLARRFIDTVKKLIPKDGEEILFNALRQYQSSLNLDTFMSDLKTVFNEPDKLCLFDEIRPLITLNQQIAYDNLCPIIHSETKKVIRLRNAENGSLGFSLRGGVEHGTGIFVTNISTTSEAYKKDLRCGDQIISINGFNVFDAIHAEIIDLINDLEEIVLKIKRIGMVPFRTKASDVVRWEYIAKENVIQNISSYPIKIFINMSTTGGLGCRIVSGPPHQKGIYVQFVKPDCLAHEAGLESGDQILSVNDTSFLDVTHSQAVVALKTSQHLLLRIRKKVAMSWIDSLYTANKGETPATQHNNVMSSIYSIPTLSSSSNGLSSSKTTDGYRFSGESGRQEAGQLQSEIKVEVYNGFDDNKSPYEEVDNGYNFSEPPHDFLTDSESHSSNHDNSPVDSNFIMYKNPELSLSNENVAALSENEARKLFTVKEIGGRQIRTINIKTDGPLGIELEGGLNSPLEGRILVSNIFAGSVYRQGGMHVGDELLMANKVKFIGKSLTEATNFLKKAEMKKNHTIEFIMAVAPPKSYEEEMTFF